MDDFYAARSRLIPPLPWPTFAPPFSVYAEWKKCRAGLDYHIAIDRHYYSVPHQLLKKELWARITTRTVEVFHVGQRVASHVRTSGNGQHSTQRDHMPAHHRFREDWTPQRIQERAARVGPNVAVFAEVVMRDRKHPEQGYRTCLGVERRTGCPPVSFAIRSKSWRTAVDMVVEQDRRAVGRGRQSR